MSLYDATVRALHAMSSPSVDVADVTEDRVVLVIREDLPTEARAELCRWLVEKLTAWGFACTRSRTRVRVRRAPEVLGPPDFACKEGRR